MSSPPSLTTTSHRNSFTTPSFISLVTQNNLSSPPYLNGKWNIPRLTTMSQIATSTHTSTFETHRRVLWFKKGEAHTYKRDWITTMEAASQPLRRQQWRRRTTEEARSMTDWWWRDETATTWKKEPLCSATMAIRNGRKRNGRCSTWRRWTVACYF